ncbi:tRNA lysidine(34) synthetase TilS [Kineobactrum sediminis]|uniref:tRNA(Ile)-lysidine synthase n=1 Tax=Kineobactrum sediminis TaxID=1905677 RepID=A0A2N5Y1N0_9GAMM|nr:tRNA lysidine(34) synthetase TilS [Kineobactrum sediminis]PLW82307.1 tRNA lysidine(34) synthetase TilS [Kineobactrum sediminis]
MNTADALELSSLAPALKVLEPARRWLLAFSGGLDSTVLLHLLNRYCLSCPQPPELVAVHVNHGLQAQAQAWELHCRQVCAGLEVPLVVRRVEVACAGKGVEAAARDARYHALAELLEPGDAVFFAHHQDDQLETILLRLLRGAGLRGLQGMPSRRPFGSQVLHRPLLAFPRHALAEYARRHRLAWVEDPSNTDISHDRNFLRHEIVPLLEQRWPAVRETATRSARQLAASANVLQQLLPAPVAVTSIFGDPGMALPDLLDMPLDMRVLVLRDWLAGQHLPMPAQAPMLEFLRQLAAGGSPVLDCGGYRLQRFGDGVYRLPVMEPGPWNHSLDPAVRLAPGDVLSLPGVGELSLQAAGSGPGILLEPGEHLTLGWRRGGERCRPLGRNGSQRLKKLLQEAAVPPWWRDRVPLLYLAGELVAVADLWFCVSSRVVPGGDEEVWRPDWIRNTYTAAD